MPGYTRRPVKSTVTTLESNKVKLSVEVDEHEIDAAIDEAFKKIAKEIRLPGFRPGKAPRKVLEARIGRDYARSEAIRDALPEYYRKAIVENDVDVISPPDLDITSGEEAGPVAFEAVVEVRPVVIVAGYDGLRVELPALEPSDDDVTSQVDALRAQFSERVAVDRPAETGDYVTMDIETTQEGEVIEGLTAQGYTYELGAGFVVDELDDQLAGAVVGDVVAFDADHPDPDEDGQLSFSVTVTAIEAKQLPELDDEFVADATEFETVEEFLTDTRERLATMKRAQAKTLIPDRTATALAELVVDEIPDALVTEAVQNQLQDMAMRLASQGIGLEQFLQMTGQSVEDLMANMREPATEAAKVDLALRAVVVAEGLEVTDDELDAEIAESAEAMGRPPEELRAALETNGQLSSVRIDMAKRKAMDFLVASVALVDPEGHPIDRDLLDEEDLDEGDLDDAAAEATEIDDAGNTEDDSSVATSADDHHEADPSADEGEQQ